MPDARITSSRHGKELTVDAENVAVVDDVSSPTSVEIPAAVSFRLTWKASGPRRRLGHPHTAAPTDPDAFLGRLARAKATGSFSGTQAGFVFQSSGKSTFAELGTEQNGGVPRAPCHRGLSRVRGAVGPSGGFLAALRAIEKHPHGEIFCEILEPMGNTRRSKEKVAGLDRVPACVTDEGACAPHHDVAFIPRMR